MLSCTMKWNKLISVEPWNHTTIKENICGSPETTAHTTTLMLLHCWEFQPSTPQSGNTKTQTTAEPECLPWSCQHFLQPVKELPYKPTALLPWRQRLGQQVCQIEVSVDVGRSPLIPRTPLPDEMVRQAIHLLLDHGRWHCRLGQYQLVVNIAGSSHGIPIILSLYLSPRTYSTACFIAVSSDP